MANLQLNIEVNDEEFKTLCTNNINDLPKDKMEEILLKAVENALLHDKEKDYYESDKSLLIKRTTKVEYYGYESTSYEATQFFKDCMEKVDLTKYVDGVAETIQNYIINNYEKIIKEYIMEKFAEMLFSKDKEWDLRNSIMSQVRNNIDRM